MTLQQNCNEIIGQLYPLLQQYDQKHTGIVETNQFKQVMSQFLLSHNHRSTSTLSEMSQTFNLDFDQTVPYDQLLKRNDFRDFIQKKLMSDSSLTTNQDLESTPGFDMQMNNGSRSSIKLETLDKTLQGNSGKTMGNADGSSKTEAKSSEMPQEYQKQIEGEVRMGKKKTGSSCY